MKFTAALSAVLGVASVAAVPRAVDLGDGVTLAPRKSTTQPRQATRRRARLAQEAKDSPHVPDKSTHARRALLSDDWAGAVLSGHDIKHVSGTITVPELKSHDCESSVQYGASVWVGIDGNSCHSGILQTGVDLKIEGDTPSYSAWYEWWPGESYKFENFDISLGDNITLTVDANTKYDGLVTIINNTKDKTLKYNIYGRTPLCQTDAEWIVEDFKTDGALIPFADFGVVTFTNASHDLGGTDISSHDSGSVEIFNIVQKNEQVVTNCSTEGSNTVRCMYIL